MKAASEFPAITRTAKWLLLLSFLFLLITIFLVFIAKNTGPDDVVFSFTAAQESSSTTGAMRFISFFGKHSFLIPANLLLIIFFIVLKNKWGAISTAVIALSSLGLMSSLKNLIQRHRPANPLVEGITNYGFPSGHAMMSVVFYGLLACWIAVLVRNKTIKSIVISFLLLLVLLIGYSRIYLRVHYSTDVIAGFCIGICWLFFCLWLINKIKRASGLVPKQ